MSEQTVHLVERLRERLRATVRRITLADVAFGLSVLLGVASAVWFVSVALEAGLWLDPTPRTVLFGTVALITLGTLGYYVVRPLLRLAGLLPTLSDEDAARRVGQRYPEVSDRLVNLLQLAEGRRSDAPEPMIDGAVQRLGAEVQPVPFEDIETFDRAKRSIRLASLPLIGLLLFLLVAPTTFFGASERLLSPRDYFERPAPFQLSVAPGNIQLIRGDSLQITVRATGSEMPRALNLLVQNEDEERAEEIEIPAGPDGTYRHTLVNVRQPINYRIEADPVATAWYRADVTARPMIRSLQATVTPPAYTGLPKQTLDPNVGDVTGLPGTRIDLSLQLGGPDVALAAVVFDDGARDTLSIEDGQARGSFTLRREGTYHVELLSAADIANQDPIQYQLKLRADARPSIVFLAPEPLADVSDDLVVPLRLRLSDDYGFRRLRLHYRLSEQRFGDAQEEFDHIDLPLAAPRQLDQEVIHDWLLAQESGLDLVPGDEVEYYAEVWDNDAVSGFKAARTGTQRLRMPSLTEQYESLDEQQDTAENQIEDLKRDAESMRDQFRNLRDELRSKQEADWEDRRQLERLQNQQKQVESGVEELSQQVDELTRQMQENSLTSPETSQMYEDLKRVIEEINSPELENALKELQESLQNLDLRQMQQALENFEFNEDQYQQRLQRTLDLFKQLRAQQKMEEIARRADELSKLEERLAEETGKRKGDTPAREDEADDQEGDTEDSSAEEAQDAAEKPSDEPEAGDEANPADEAREDEQNDSEAPAEDESAENESADSETAEDTPEGEKPRDGTPPENQEGTPTDQEGPQENNDAQDGENQNAENQQRSGEQQTGEQQGGEQDTPTPLPEPNRNGQNPSQRDQSGPDESPENQQQGANEDLAQEQQRAREEMQKLEEEMQKLSEQMKETPAAPQQQMQQMQQQLQEQQLPKQMQQNMQQLRQNQLNDAQQGQQQMSQQLQQMRQQMQQMQAGMQGQQQQINMAGLRTALDNTLRLSQGQESLRHRVQDASSESPTLRQHAQKQSDLEAGLRTVSDSLQALSRSIPQMSRAVQKETGDALREMQSATSSLSERNAGRASGYQKGSMTHLNELALLLSDLMDQMQNSQGGGGGMSMQQMLQQMQQMSGQQQKLNQQVQQFLNDVQGNRLSGDQQKRLKQLGEQQGRIKKQLEELSKSTTGDMRDRILGDLQKIADQMQETINELEAGQQNRRTVKRQQEILTRMLNAQRSLRTQGKENKREGRTSEDAFDRESPDDLSPQEQAEQLRRDLIRALESGYAPDYEELIKRYYELLQQQGVDEE